MTFTDDTVAGFEFLTEIHCDDIPQVVSIIGRSQGMIFPDFQDGTVDRLKDLFLVGEEKIVAHFYSV